MMSSTTTQCLYVWSLAMCNKTYFHKAVMMSRRYKCRHEQLSTMCNKTKVKLGDSDPLADMPSFMNFCDMQQNSNMWGNPETRYNLVS